MIRLYLILSLVATAHMAGAIAGGFAVGWLIDSVVVMRQ